MFPGSRSKENLGLLLLLLLTQSADGRMLLGNIMPAMRRAAKQHLEQL